MRTCLRSEATLLGDSLWLLIGLIEILSRNSLDTGIVDLGMVMKI